MTAAGPSAKVAGGEDAGVLTAASIAALVGGRIIGNGSVQIDAIAPLGRAGPRDLSFLASDRYAGQFAESRAGVVLVSPALAECEGPSRTRIVVEQPHDALLRVLPILYRHPVVQTGIHESAIVGRGARVGPGTSIGPRVVLGTDCAIGEGCIIGANCVIGDGVEIGVNSRLHANVTLYSGTAVAERVIIHSGAVIGSDGFGYVYRDNVHRRIPHIGRCIIESDVEIGANAAIDRGSISDTVIGAGTKIDNLVHVAHNVQIGRLCLIMAQVGIAGSATVGDGAILAGQVGVGGHTTIGSGARLGGQAGVFGDIPAGETWSGYPARPHKDSLRAQAALFRLVKILRPLERLIQDWNPKA